MLRLHRLRALRRTEGGDLLAEAGVTHAAVTRYCVEHGLSGLEFAAGIPGTVGGWVAMNAGVPEREVKDALRGRRADGRRAARGAACRGKGSRSATGAAGLPPGAIVVAAAFAVRDADRDAVREGGRPAPFEALPHAAPRHPLLRLGIQEPAG